MFLLRQIQGVLYTVSILDILDIIVVAYFLNKLYQMLKNTRAASLVKGLLVLFAATLVSKWLNLYVINWLLEKSMVIGWSMFIGGIFINVFLQPWPFIGIMDFGTVIGMTVLILFGTLIAFYCYLDSTKYIKASEVGALASVEPLSSVLLAVVILHVDFGLAEILGVACPLCGVL